MTRKGKKKGGLKEKEKMGGGVTTEGPTPLGIIEPRQVGRRKEGRQGKKGIQALYWIFWLLGQRSQKLFSYENF